MKQKQTETITESTKAFQADPALKELAQQAAEKASALKVDKFLSAEQLKLTDRQRTALIKTLNLMETHGIDHEKHINGPTLTGSWRFDMREWVSPESTLKNECGTVCCIGGTASLLDGGPYASSITNSIFHDQWGKLTGDQNLANLFYRWSKRGKKVTVDCASQQLRKYLETGMCPWDWADK
jgi:hypothetical protein